MWYGAAASNEHSKKKPKIKKKKPKCGTSKGEGHNKTTFPLNQ